jgi:hypothetical protein
VSSILVESSSSLFPVCTDAMVEPRFVFSCAFCYRPLYLPWVDAKPHSKIVIGCGGCECESTWRRIRGEDRSYMVTEFDGREWKAHFAMADSPIATPPPSPRDTPPEDSQESQGTARGFAQAEEEETVAAPRSPPRR